MEVKDARCTFISNQEVMAVLKAAREEHHKELRSHNTVVYEVLKYLDDTPVASQSEEDVRSCISALQGYNLTAAELLQIVNNRPVSQVELQMIIEESEERLKDEQLEEMLDIISQRLPERRTQKENGQ